MTSDVSTADAEKPRTLTNIGTSLVISSVLGSTLGIVIAQWLDNFGDGLAAELLGGDAVVFNNRVVITGDVSDLAFGGGFALCLLVGFLALFAYPTQRGYGIPRLTFLWMLLHFLRQGLVQAVSLPFAEGGYLDHLLQVDSQLSLAYGTLEAPPVLEIVIAVAGAVGLLLIALSAASAFLAYTPHRRFVSDSRKRVTFVLWVAVIPAVASAFLAIPFFVPDTERLVIRSLPLVAVIFLATLAAAPGSTTVIGPEDERSTPWPWGLGATLVVLLVFYLAVVQGGISVDPRQWG